MKRLLFISFLTFASCGEIPTFDLDAGDSPDCPPCSYNRTSCQAVQVEDCIDNCIDRNGCFFEFSIRACIRECAQDCLEILGCGIQ